MDDLGKEMHRLCGELFPICRSITGNGVRKTLCLLKDHLPELKIYEIPTGEVCFDWNIPKEWNIRDAYVIDPEGNKIIDFQNSNLHVVGYSIPVNKTATLEELQEHLDSLPRPAHCNTVHNIVLRREMGVLYLGETEETFKTWEVPCVY
jgi:aminopeptidase-like protein